MEHYRYNVFHGGVACMRPLTTIATDSESGRESLAVMLRRLAAADPKLRVAWEVAPDGTARCVFQILATVPK